MSAAHEPLNQQEFVELLSDLIDDGRDVAHAFQRSDAETVADTEMHVLEVTAGVEKHMIAHIRILMVNGQRWRVTVEAMR